MKRLTMITGVILMVILVLGFTSCGKKEETKAEEKVNINTATAQELQRVPGVDQALAQNIVAYRNMNGPYVSVEDLNRVSGIDKDKFDSMRNYITVEDKSSSRQGSPQGSAQQSPSGSQPSQKPGQQESSR